MTTTWRYYLPATEDRADSWSIVFVDSTGAVAILSDYGNWCYRWATAHTGFKDFREFLLDVHWDYVARKLGRREDLSVYDGEATRKNIEDRITRARRDGALTKEDARTEWDLARQTDEGLVGFHDWYQQTTFGDAYEMKVDRMDYGLRHWATVSLPRLKELIAAELRAQRCNVCLELVCECDRGER